MKKPLTIEAEARSLVDGARQTSYGPPAESLERIAMIWSAILKVEVLPRQVALCMAGLKLAREANVPKRDNRVDVVGYMLLEDEHTDTKV